MLESVLKLVFPVVLSGAWYFKEYGLGGVKDFSGWGSIRLIFLFVFMLHLTGLVALGEQWFCGYCSFKAKSSAFLYPGIGYSLVLFSGVFVGSVFRTSQGKIAEFGIAAIGTLFTFYGVLWILATKS